MTRGSSLNPPKYARPSRGSVFDAVEPKVCELLGTDPRMPATPIAERIGWTYSVRLLRIPVRELRDAACVGPIYFAGVEAGNA